MKNLKPKEGDWIMWVSAGKPIIAEILRIRDQAHYPWKDEYITTEGITCSFIELREKVIAKYEKS